MLGIEIIEGKNRMALKECCAEVGLASQTRCSGNSSRRTDSDVPEGRVHTLAPISKLPCHTHQPGG